MITYDDMLRYLRRAVDEVGAHYIDPIAADPDLKAKMGSCQYIYDADKYGGCGHCIIGWVMKNCLAVSEDSLAMRCIGSARQALRYTNIEMTKEAINLASRTQRQQDEGKTWAQAVHLAHMTRALDRGR